MANDKLHRFIQAALTNPRHPVYQFRATNPILQHYAVNVKMDGAGLLETIAPEDWEKNYPESVKTMTEVMRLCEEDAAEAMKEAAAQVEQARKLKEAEDKVKSQAAEIEQLKAAQAPAGE